FLGDLPDRPFGGYPQCLVASFLLCACTHDLVGLRIVLEHRDELGDALVGVTHVRVGPHHELTACAPGADTAYGARTPVVPEGDHLHVWIEPLDVSETFQGGVGGGVVHGEQFVPVTGAGHRRADPLDLVDDVLLLVVAGQHDTDPHRKFHGCVEGPVGDVVGVVHGFFRSARWGRCFYTVGRARVQPRGGTTATHTLSLKYLCPVGGLMRVLGSISASTWNGRWGSPSVNRSSGCHSGAASTAVRPRSWISATTRSTDCSVGSSRDAVGKPHTFRNSGI